MCLVANESVYTNEKIQSEPKSRVLGKMCIKLLNTHKTETKSLANEIGFFNSV